MKNISKELFQRIRRIQIRTTRSVDDLFAGAYRAAFKGRGMEFEEVREYQDGDEIRTIDWNVTARMDHPYVKIFREERELTVMLIVDVSASARFGSTSYSKSEIIAEIAAVLALSAIKNEDKVGIILFSDIIEKYIPPKKGTRHVLRVIRELLAFEPKEKGTDLEKALSFLGSVRRRPAVCFLISDFLVDNDPKDLALIAKKHDLIAICVNDPEEISFPSLGLLNLKDLETGAQVILDTTDSITRQAFAVQAIERMQKHKIALNKVGASFVTIETNKPYVDPLRRFFKLRERRK